MTFLRNSGVTPVAKVRNPKRNRIKVIKGIKNINKRLRI